MPYTPDDDRFYQTLGNAGNTYRDQRNRVAEEQSAGIRERGQLYGQLPNQIVGGAMKGADWRQNREKENQRYQQSAAEEGRTADQYDINKGRDARLWQSKLGALGEGDQQLEQRTRYNNSPVTEEEAAANGVAPGSTHYQAGLGLADKSRMENLTTARTGNAATNENIASSKQGRQIRGAEEGRTGESYALANAAEEYKTAQSIPDAQQRTNATNSVINRYEKKGIPRDRLMAAAQANETQRASGIGAATEQRYATSRVTNADQVAQGNAIADDVKEATALTRAADEYKHGAHAGFAYTSTPQAADAKRVMKTILTKNGKNEAASSLDNLTDVLNEKPTQAAHQHAQDVISRAMEWWATTPPAVRELPEFSQQIAGVQALAKAQRIPLPSGYGQSAGPAGPQKDEQTGRNILNLTGGAGSAPGASMGNVQFMQGGGVPVVPAPQIPMGNMSVDLSNGGRTGMIQTAAPQGQAQPQGQPGAPQPQGQQLYDPFKFEGVQRYQPKAATAVQRGQ